MTRVRSRIRGGTGDLTWRIAGVVVTAVVNDRMESTFTRTVTQAVIIAAVALVPPAVVSARAEDTQDRRTTAPVPNGVAPWATGWTRRARSRAARAVQHEWGDAFARKHPPVIQNVLVLAVRDVWQSPSAEKRRDARQGPSASGMWPADGLVIGAAADSHVPDHDPSTVQDARGRELPVP